MKILAIIGSPRKKGNSYSVIKRIEDKIKNIGNVEFEYLFLSDVNLELCQGCGVCLLKGEEHCPNKDDRKQIEDKILNADGVIFISPVYAMNMTALIKNLLDRTAYTMHRPRFFNQYTMIVSVTGSVGLKETINSLSAIKYSGYNIVHSFGIVATDPFINTKISDSKSLKDIDFAAEKFYKTIINKKPMVPSFDNIMQFRMQQRVFDLLKDKLTCDHNYFKEKGWLDKKKKFYTDNAKINPIKNLIARWMSLTLIK